MRPVRLLLALIFAAACLPAAAQSPRMSEAEARQLFEAGGFRIAQGRAFNVCGRQTTPKYTFVDLNGDRRPEALATDASPGCYGKKGTYFALLVRGPDGRWRVIAKGEGDLRIEGTSTRGWKDVRVNTDCDRLWRFDGQVYGHEQACAGPAGPTLMTGASAAGAVPRTEYPAIFAAAGFKQRGGKWTGETPECDATLDPADVRDLNGDGVAEAIVVESGTFCYGMTGQGIYLMTRTAPGRWSLIFQSPGIADFKTTRTRGWPDLVMGGPGFCQPLYKWTGKTYDHAGQIEEERGACARR